MKKPKGFTLIELSAVIVILLLLISISIPLLNKGSSQNEIKLVTQSVQSLLSLCSSLAKSAGRVYMADMDLSFSSSPITDPSDNKNKNTLKRFSIMRIYSCAYNENTKALEYSFEKDSYNIPVSIGAYLNIESGQTDHIYFKPDGSVVADAPKSPNPETPKILFCSPNNTNQYYVLDINRTTGTFVSRSYKD